MTSQTFLSEHFSLEEAIISQTADRNGLDNTPSLEMITTMSKTAVRLEKVRSILAKPLNINSWYRALLVNRAVGSKDTSQHMKGEAVDFISPEFGSPLLICQELLKYKELVRWDQLILEHTWVHISWASVPNAVQRGQVLSLLATGQYATGLTDNLGKAYQI